jgi:predicted naringenin-chalcone synthase
VTTAHINRIATGVPTHDVHEIFLGYARSLLGRKGNEGDERFERMSKMAAIDHRYSCINPLGGFYGFGRTPTTAERMRAFDEHAPDLAVSTVERLNLGSERDSITHVLITCCTGFSAPGLDFQLIERCGLPTSVERVIIGFMGCHAAINALKLARHIVRSEPDSRVLILNLELCTLHLRETNNLEEMLSFLLFADGCAACLVSSEPEGLAMDGFRAVMVPQTKELITWHIRDCGFEMMLSSRVPGAIRRALAASSEDILSGRPPSEIDLWAIHPGGTSVIDAVQRAFDIEPDALSASRGVLRSYGNMSSATVMFVLDEIMRASHTESAGCAMSFGPGMVAETMMFRSLGEKLAA